MIMRKFWLWDSDPEDEIYETLAWDLPGYKSVDGKPRRPVAKRSKVRPIREKRP
jgi:hypothetical protein